ncbi:GDSL family lipase [Rariglobus hedericola]|uniref:GDSL family lipase n=2 Tax=Rariglobus hedericola TaxID=2597822 RepID=A0A556QLL4_9BACT|nr:GDSL family lipase [Rariglobus hedericola]
MKPLTRLVPCVLLSLLGCVALSAQPAANPATNPVPRNDWMVQHEGFNARAKKGDVDVVFLGDSITAGWGGAGKTIWAERYTPLKAANFGIGGDRTQHVLWRVQNGNFAGITPKAVVLMIGTNNTGSDTAPQIAEGVEAIVKEIQTLTPKTKILLLAVFPRAEKSDNPARVKIGQINEIIAKLDDGQKVFFLDIGPKFLQPDGTLTRDIMPDLLHLSPAGYKIWADAIQDKLTELLK